MLQAKLWLRMSAALALLTTTLFSIPAHAQTETVLYNFSGGSDGGDPGSGLTPDGAGNFYGTTYGGGAGFGFGGNGTVFELSPNGSGGWNETVLYTFTGPDGSQPSYAGVIFDRAGNLYGTAYNGGATGNGVVFELSPSGSGWTETVLYNFCSQPDCTDGAHPMNGLIMDSAGNLFGTVATGHYGYGGVFELTPSDGGWTEQLIDPLPIGNTWASGLVMDGSGNIFGLVDNNVQNGTSEIFEVSPNGKGGWTYAFIYTFPFPLGYGPYAYGTPTLDKAGHLYGTTSQGGPKGHGTVYRLSPGKPGKQWKAKTLYTFRGGKKDGSYPFAGVVLDASGNIYGVTENGPGSAPGAVFKLTPPLGTGGYKEKILWAFNGTDGYQPYYPLIFDSAGNLFGTTSFGGASGWGVAFEVTP